MLNQFRNKRKHGDCNIPEVAAGIQRFNILQNMKGKENYHSWKNFWGIKYFSQKRCLDGDNKTIEKHRNFGSANQEDP